MYVQNWLQEVSVNHSLDSKLPHRARYGGAARYCEVYGSFITAIGWFVVAHAYMAVWGYILLHVCSVSWGGGYQFKRDFSTRVTKKSPQTREKGTFTDAWTAFGSLAPSAFGSEPQHCLAVCK